MSRKYRIREEANKKGKIVYYIETKAYFFSFWDRYCYKEGWYTTYSDINEALNVLSGIKIKERIK